MPSIDATLTWAVPVKPDLLAAHTQAYVDTLPAMNALRLCNRFGQGSRCYINKLPVELVKQIEEHIVTPVRKERAKKWTDNFRCFKEEGCTYANHDPDRTKILDLYHHMRTCDWVDTEEEEELGEDASNEELVNAIYGMDGHNSMEWLNDEGWGPHFENRCNWESDARDLFIQQRSMLQKHFNLDVWLSHVRLDSEYIPTETTIAYLILPDRASLSKRWRAADEENESFYASTQHGVGMTVNSTTPLTAKELHGFSRGLRILGLEVCAHESQKGNALSSDVSGKKSYSSGDASEKEKEIEPDATATPQLTLLLRNLEEEF